jgi:hypothetical protein
MASRSICERSSNLSSTLSARASVPTSTRKKRASEYLGVGAVCRLLDVLGIAVRFTQPPLYTGKAAKGAAFRSPYCCLLRQRLPGAVIAGTRNPGQQIRAASAPRSMALVLHQAVEAQPEHRQERLYRCLQCPSCRHLC